MLILPFQSYSRLGNRGPRLINCFAEDALPSSAQPVTLYGSPGIATWGTAPRMGCRGAIGDATRCYAVCGTRLYSFNVNGVATEVGTIPGSDRVRMAYNGTQLCIVAGGKGYIYTGSGGVVQITDPDFTQYTPIDVTYADGFFLFCAADGNWWKSALYDGTSYEGDEYDQAAKYADQNVAMIAAEMQIVIAGTSSIEFWHYSGQSPFPYSRSPNGVAEIGVAARDSLVKDEQGVYFLASDCTVRVIPTTSTEPVRISTHGVEDALCGLLFNAMAYLLHVLRKRGYGTR